MPDLNERAQKLLHERFSTAAILSNNSQLMGADDDTVLKPIHLCVTFDPANGVRQSLLAVPDLGSHDELRVLAGSVPTAFGEMKSSSPISAAIREESAIHNNQWADAPRLIIYTDALHCKESQVYEAFKDIPIEIISESDMLDSVFISYGGPDEHIATLINDGLVANGVNTWFFPKDAIPGQKLHRVMSDGVTKHDRVILICSRSSLDRTGVLNEIERVLEREAREGGADILIPISLDDFIFADWKPKRPDIAEQIRSRIITAFPQSENQVEFDAALKKLLKALRRI